MNTIIDKSYEYKFSEDKNTISITDLRDNTEITCFLLPDAKITRWRFGDTRSRNLKNNMIILNDNIHDYYVTMNCFYNAEHDMVVIIENYCYDQAHSNKDTCTIRVYSIQDFIRHCLFYVPTWLQSTSTTSSISHVCKQSKIFKLGFTLLATSSTDLKQLVAIFAAKAQHFGIHITCNYSNVEQFNIKCDTQEDLSMFLWYFQEYIKA